MIVLDDQLYVFPKKIEPHNEISSSKNLGDSDQIKAPLYNRYSISESYLQFNKLTEDELDEVIFDVIDQDNKEEKVNVAEALGFNIIEKFWLWMLLGFCIVIAIFLIALIVWRCWLVKRCPLDDDSYIKIDDDTTTNKIQKEENSENTPSKIILKETVGENKDSSTSKQDGVTA